jgi:hypothetical protein
MGGFEICGKENASLFDFIATGKVGIAMLLAPTNFTNQ